MTEKFSEITLIKAAISQLAARSSALGFHELSHLLAVAELVADEDAATATGEGAKEASGMLRVV